MREPTGCFLQCCIATRCWRKSSTSKFPLTLLTSRKSRQNKRSASRVLLGRRGVAQLGTKKEFQKCLMDVFAESLTVGGARKRRSDDSSVPLPFTFIRRFCQRVLEESRFKGHDRVRLTPCTTAFISPPFTELLGKTRATAAEEVSARTALISNERGERQGITGHFAHFFFATRV